MANKSWAQAVEAAVRRHVATTGSSVFTRQSLIDAELPAIVADTGSAGATPDMTLSRELQQLREAGIVEFVDDRGTYRLLTNGKTKGVFLLRSDAIYNDNPTHHYQFPSMYLDRARRMVGEMIVYMEPAKAGDRGYHAVARVSDVVADPTTSGMYLALIEPGSYQILGRDVPFRVKGEVVERGLLSPNGRVNSGRAIWAVRPISNSDFDRILELGGVTAEDELLPRTDDPAAVLPMVAEEQTPFEPVLRDRVLLLTNRKVRDRLFRRRVLDAYDCRCALTGMKLINGGGRAEAEAAHIVPVEADGPDDVTNGLALSGTVHWMFDRGLVSLEDTGKILISSKINDIEGVGKIIHSDRMARLPTRQDLRPHPRYLSWHRENRFCA